MNRLTTSIAAALFCLTAGLAYAHPGDGGRGSGGRHHGFQPCSQAADPAKCDAERQKMREDFRAAREACRGNADARGCMTQQYCGKQANPAQCLERAKERQAQRSKRMDERQAIAEACTGKRGDDLQKCYRDQFQKRGAPAAK
jgi:Spy/CpxP family protein refolding chaperone